jgi:YebC/PmpR family DNA-binding regulatory protein
MAGHSKWANIQHRKGAQDKKRSKVFSKVVKDIMVAARMGGEDPDANARLRLAIVKAKAVSLPKDTLERAIKKGAGTLEGVDYEEIMYEAYGPGGVAILVECLTDNRNRTAGEVRHAFSRRGLALASSGAAAHSFNQVGQVAIPMDTTDEDTLLMAAMEHGGDDILQDTDSDSGTEVFRVICAKEDLEGLREGLEGAGFELASYGLYWVPSVTSPVEGEDAGKLMALLDVLEELDDTQNIYANYEISDEEMERLAAG